MKIRFSEVSKKIIATMVVFVLGYRYNAIYIYVCISVQQALDLIHHHIKSNGLITWEAASKLRVPSIQFSKNV